jgi:hypothetical protein
MKKETVFKLVKAGVILVLIALVTTTGSKLTSELYLTEKTETDHFIFSWTKDEAQFFDCLPAAVEENYQRISKDLNSTASGKITIKPYDNSWIYNLSIGNPLPWPKLRASGNADYRRKIIDVLLPPLDDPVYQEKNVLQLFCMTGIGHEIAHILISEINPRFIRGWWHEGIAEYEHLIPLKDHDGFKELKESNERAIKTRVATGNIPTFEELSVRDFNKFVGMNGYEFSTEFVNFAVSEFGPEVIRRMAKYPEDYDRVFNASKEEVWQHWLEYLTMNYSDENL